MLGLELLLGLGLGFSAEPNRAWCSQTRIYTILTNPLTLINPYLSLALTLISTLIPTVILIGPSERISQRQGLAS